MDIALVEEMSAGMDSHHDAETAWTWSTLRGKATEKTQILITVLDKSRVTSTTL